MTNEEWDVSRQWDFGLFCSFVFNQASQQLLGLLTLKLCIPDALFMDIKHLSETYIPVPLRCSCYHHRQGASTRIPGVERVG